MNNNIIAAALAMLKNAGASRRMMVVLKQCSNLLENILICLKDNGYIKDMKKYVNNGKITIIVQLAYYQPRQIIGMKDYMKMVTIEEFYKENESKMFDMKAKISSPKVASTYAPVIKTLVNKSTGGYQIFTSYKDLINYRDQSNSFGLLILTTSKGVLSHVEAIKNQVGGKVLIGVY